MLSLALQDIHSHTTENALNYDKNYCQPSRNGSGMADDQNSNIY